MRGSALGTQAAWRVLSASSCGLLPRDSANLQRAYRDRTAASTTPTSCSFCCQTSCFCPSFLEPNWKPEDKGTHWCSWYRSAGAQNQGQWGREWIWKDKDAYHSSTNFLAQIIEHLFCKSEALSSNSSSTKKQKQQQQQQPPISWGNLMVDEDES
jgi:hypothetical protein